MIKHLELGGRKKSSKTDSPTMQLMKRGLKLPTPVCLIR